MMRLVLDFANRRFVLQDDMETIDEAMPRKTDKNFLLDYLPEQKVQSADCFTISHTDSTIALNEAVVFTPSAPYPLDALQIRETIPCNISHSVYGLFMSQVGYTWYDAEAAEEALANMVLAGAGMEAFFGC